MRFVTTALTLTITAIAIISCAASAQEKQPRWIDFGAVGTGDKLQLDINSILRTKMPIDDKINMEGRDGSETASIPMRNVIAFSYKIGGRTRSAYTISCNGRNLNATPSWRTSTTYVDYWPQYFSVPADSPASRQMLKNVCVLGIAK